MSDHDTNERNVKTHRDLMPKDLCPYLMMKQILTHGLDEEIEDDREWPGDGFYWCQLTLHDIGPDDEIVHPADCRKGRSCWVSTDLG